MQLCIFWDEGFMAGPETIKMNPLFRKSVTFSGLNPVKRF